MGAPPVTMVFAYTFSSFHIITAFGGLYVILTGCWTIHWLISGLSGANPQHDTTSLREEAQRQHDEILALRKQLGQSTEAFQEANSRVESLRLEVLAMEHRINQLDWDAKGSTRSNNESPSETPSFVEEAPAASEGLKLFTPDPLDQSTLDERYGLIYSSSPHSPDDLTQLWGIGGVSHQRLNELGVYCFEQIANWTPQHVEAFNQALGFDQRIQREEWVRQAARRVQADAA